MSTVALLAVARVGRGGYEGCDRSGGQCLCDRSGGQCFLFLFAHVNFVQLPFDEVAFAVFRSLVTTGLDVCSAGLSGSALLRQVVVLFVGCVCAVGRLCFLAFVSFRRAYSS